jgi:gliding motility-associated-like protein
MMKFYSAIFFMCFIFSGLVNAQTCFTTGVNGTTINIPCSETCTPINLKVRDLKSSSEYNIESIPYAPFPFTAVTEASELYIDDRFSQAFSNSFAFCFYDSLFSQFVLGSNGVMTFDLAQANCSNAWKLENGSPVPLPFLGAQVCGNSTGPKYSPYSIFSPYHDINPNVTSTSPNRRVSFRIYGFAPCRVQVVSFFEIPLFGHTSQLNTSQIVIYENTGVVEIFIREKRLDTDGSVWNQNLAILGIQKDATKAHPVPGKNATVWEEYNTGYRFVPAGPATRFIKSELLSMSGALLQTTTQSAPSATPGLRDVNFSNTVCPTSTVQYQVKTYYSLCSPTSIPMIYTDTITVNGNPPLTGNAATTNPSCQGASNGTATITPASAAGAPFEYSKDGVTWQTSATFNNLAAGNYSFSYRTNAGCVSLPITATIQPGIPLTSTIAVTNALCNGDASGTATITVSNSGNFEYSLDNLSFQSSNIFSNLLAGSYTAYFKEPSGCSGSKTFTITEPTALSSSMNTTPVTCNGQSNGQISVSATGGTAPYTYAINGGSYQSSGIFNVSAGSYNISIKDNNGCIVTDVAEIQEPSALTASAAVTNASCEGGADGTISVTASGGTGNYQYSINGAYQSSNVFYVTSGTYTVTVKDANNCTVNVSNVSVGMNNNLVVTPTPDPAAICESLSVVLQPQTNATQFSWTPAPGLNSTTIKNPVASPSITTAYYLTATLGLCTAFDTIVVTVLPAPVPDAGPDGNICYGQSHTLQGSGGIGYQWGPSTAFNSNSTSPSPVVTPVTTSTYQLHVVDANGCNSLQPDIVTVQVTPPIVIVATKDTIVAMGDTFQLFANSAATDYVWSPPTGLSDPNISNPVVTVTGDMVYQLTATTSAGCRGEATVRLTVFNGPEIYVPNAFSPNRDGKNDIFRPFPVGIKKLNFFRVFNRWGQLVYATTNLNQGWDGSINGKIQTTGTYVWMVEGVTKEDKIIRKKGTVVLIK